MIIVLGTRDDPHVEWVAVELQKRNVPCTVLDHKSPPSFEITSNEDFEFNITIDGNHIKPSVIWDRSKIFLNFYSGEDTSRNYFVTMKEWLGLFEFIRSNYRERIFPQRDKIILFSNKPIQAKIAKSCGFLVPKLIITNSKPSLVSFSESHESLVLKGLGRTQFPKKEHPLQADTFKTMQISRDDIIKCSNMSFCCAPIFSQQEIKKDYGIRIQIIDKNYFAFLIDSQKFKSTSVDWRWGNAYLKFFPIDIPTFLKKKVKKFMDSIGWLWGSMDLIVDRDGNYWFLECNPQGQWG